MTTYAWTDAASSTDDDLVEDEDAVYGTCPECGDDAVFEEMSDEELANDPPCPDPEGDGYWWVCVRCGAYPVGGVVSRPIDRVPTWQEYCARGLPPHPLALGMRLCRGLSHARGHDHPAPVHGMPHGQEGDHPSRGSPSEDVVHS